MSVNHGFSQEERLSTLEYDLKQFKTETIKAYGEMAIEMTMVKGLTEDAVKRLASLKAQIEQHFEHIDIRLDAMDAHLENIDKSFHQTNIRLKRVETQLTEQKTLLIEILARLPKNP